MDLQFYGANCVSLTHRGTRLVIDDNLAELGAKSIIKPEDVALFTGEHGAVSSGRLTLDGPGEYEVSDTSVIGIPARAHMDEPGTLNATMVKMIVGDLSVLMTGHIYPELTEAQLEKIGIVDLTQGELGTRGTAEIRKQEATAAAMIL